ncbi:MAG: flagellar basal body P-ring formation protein FlgA [Planctomycetes bacterium]|nr:flagellar basal body P-ring formation protein FlgA [Planctomycetota bacterium]
MKITLLTIFAVFAVTCLCYGAVIEILPEGRANGNYVRLQDVARFYNASDELSEMLSSVYLGKTPAEDSDRTITLEDVKCELRKKGLLENVSFTGSDKVVVTRVTVVKTPDEVAVNMLIANEIAAYARKSIADSAGMEISVTLIDMFNSEIAMLAPQEIESIKITGQSGDMVYSRPTSFFATVMAKTGKLFDLMVNVKISITRMTAVAARDLRPGITISGQDVVFQKMEVEPGRSYYASAEEIIGGKTLVMLKQGALLDGSNTKSAPLVHRRDTIVVTSENGNYAIEIVCIALQEGALSDTITVQNKKSRNNFEVRVTGKGRAVFINQ